MVDAPLVVVCFLRPDPASLCGSICGATYGRLGRTLRCPHGSGTGVLHEILFKCRIYLVRPFGEMVYVVIYGLLAFVA